MESTSNVAVKVEVSGQRLGQRRRLQSKSMFRAFDRQIFSGTGVAVSGAMSSPIAVLCALAFVTGCVIEDDPPFRDKGQVVWVEMAGAPQMAYHGVWGSDARDVLAVGDGGIARFDGEVWRLIEGVPSTPYRAVWGRSALEVWIGGDDALLARSLTGWQAQMLFDGTHPITEYSVLALGGNDAHEYAVVMTGGKLLMLVNRGSAWETLWRGANEAPRPVPQRPSLHVHGDRLLVAGAGTLVEYFMTSSLGVPMWESRLWRYGDGVPPLSVISGGADFWIAAGGPAVVVQRDRDFDPASARNAAAARDVLGIFASRANRFFLIGEPVAQRGGTRSAGITSPVEACDNDGCVLERVDTRSAVTLRAVWGDADGVVIAVGDGSIVVRDPCGVVDGLATGAMLRPGSCAP
jgi:hypothetical protein